MKRKVLSILAIGMIAGCGGGSGSGESIATINIVPAFDITGVWYGSLTPSNNTCNGSTNIVSVTETITQKSSSDVSSIDSSSGFLYSGQYNDTNTVTMTGNNTIGSVSAKHTGSYTITDATHIAVSRILTLDNGSVSCSITENINFIKQ